MKRLIDSFEKIDTYIDIKDIYDNGLTLSPIGLINDGQPANTLRLYRLTLMVGVQFAAKKDDLKYAQENARKQCVHAVYGDILEKVIACKQVLYTGDRHKLTELLNEIEAICTDIS